MHLLCTKYDFQSNFERRNTSFADQIECRGELTRIKSRRKKYPSVHKPDDINRTEQGVREEHFGRK